MRVAALVLTVALTASLLGAEPSARAATAAACGPTQRERLERATGKANIYVPGTATPICGVVLDEHRDPHAVVAAPDGTVYVAAIGQGLFAVDQTLTTANAVPFMESRRGANDTRQIEMVDGELWQASVAGLARFDRRVG
ncbi:MAG TPA: hypothetical protein VGC96_14595, partial [Candidatus Elarobacter sp.]